MTSWYMRKVWLRRRWNLTRFAWYRIRYRVPVRGLGAGSSTMAPKLGRGKYVSVIQRGPFTDIRDERTGELIRLIPYQPNHGIMVEFWPNPDRLEWRTHADFEILKAIQKTSSEVSHRKILEYLADEGKKADQRWEALRDWLRQESGDDISFTGLDDVMQKMEELDG